MIPAALMGLIKRKRCPLAPLLVCLAAAPVFQGTGLFAQNAGAPLGTEIENLEQILASVTGAERHDALVRLARLRQLSGDIESAAKNWLDAAAAGPLQYDGDALVSGVYCLAAIGEWEAAASALEPLLKTDGQEPLMLHARYLEACIQAWNQSDSAALNALAVNPRYAPLRPAIYYTLWRLAEGTSAESWRTRLVSEFPHSPEARIAANETGGADDTSATSPNVHNTAISAAIRPMWLLLPGRSGVELAAPVPVPPPAVPEQSPAAPAPGAPEGKTLQTGLFRSEANARAQAEQLQKAGYSPAISPRTVNGDTLWAVTVPAGADINRSIRELKNAGFDSFPR
jgi:tetratricopeptide (TPR) repeat protein